LPNPGTVWPREPDPLVSDTHRAGAQGRPRASGVVWSFAERLAWATRGSTPEDWENTSTCSGRINQSGNRPPDSDVRVQFSALRTPENRPPVAWCDTNAP